MKVEINIIMVLNENGDSTSEPPRKRSCITRSMTASLNGNNNSNSVNKRISEIYKVKRERSRRTRSNCYARKKARQKRKKSSNVVVNEEPEVELCDLSEEVLICILEKVTAPGLINLSKTNWLFHRLCHTDSLWKHRCKVRSR